MKTCRLKIITSNIINDIDTPQIHYISQNKKVQFKSNIDNNNQSNTNEKILEQLEEKIENQPEEKKIVNQIQLEELIKYDFINTTDKKEEKKEVNKENNNIEIKDINGKNEENNLEINNINENKEENKAENNIDIIDLCTISNQHLYEEDKNNNNNSNFYNNTSNSNNYPYTIEYKKKEINTKLRTIFKNRERKNPFMNRSLSYLNNINNKKSLIKSIVSKNTNVNKINNNNNKNKKGNILNININKSFCLNNNNSNISKNTSSNNNKLKSRNRSVSYKKNLTENSKNSKNSKNSNFSKNTKNTKNGKNSGVKINIQKVKPLQIKKIDLEESHSSYISWNIIEKNDFNLEQNLDYKLLIDDLLIKECQIIKEKENIMQKYEEKLKPLREINQKLMDENNEELDRQDELKGELIVLKTQYEKLFSLLNSDNKNNNIFVEYNDLNIIDKNQEQEEFNTKIKEIDEENKKLNENLKNGKFLLVTKPSQLEFISEQDDKNITLMLKGLFMSRHFFDTDKIVDLIWKYDKSLQTIYFLVEEFLHYFNLDPNAEKDLLLIYFYSFCKNYHYMDIDTFKNEFKKKIGNIQIYNKYVYISILLNYHRSKINQLLKILKDKDVFKLGIIKYDTFIKSLLDVGLYLDKDHSENSEEILEFLIFCMKKDCSLDLNKNKKKFDIKYSLFDLYHESLNDLIDEYNSNIIKNPFKLIRNYMKKNDINNAEYILKPLLNAKYIIKINNVEYIDITIMNKYLRKIGIIQKDEKILVDVFEEELIDKNKFIDNIYDCNINNTKEETSPEKIKQSANNLIDDILMNFK